MNEVNADIIFLVQMLGQMFGTIDRTVLPARTTESDLQVGKIPLDKALYVMVNEGIDGVQKRQYLTVLLQKIDDRLIKPREGLVLLILTRVMGGTAIEDIPASVAGLIGRKTALKREGVYRY